MIIGKLNLILCTSSYNSNDYLLAAYLIKKSNQIESIKMVDILKDTKVSKSTLLRFLKKLGYKNYTDVQYLITKEKKHQEIFKERIIEKNLRDKLAKKQRLIVRWRFGMGKSRNKHGGDGVEWQDSRMVGW